MDRYEFVRHLGRGAFGVVEEHRRRSDGAAVAIKQVPTAGLPPEERAAVLAEVAVLQRLHHPSIVRYYDSFEAAGAICIVTELLPGGDLERFLAAQPGKVLPPGMAARVLRGVLEGLQYVHLSRGMHRDIKPANILLDADGAPRLADFGVSRLAATGSPGLWPTVIRPQRCMSSIVDRATR